MRGVELDEDALVSIGRDKGDFASMSDLRCRKYYQEGVVTPAQAGVQGQLVR
jgi:hypothetical protein